MGNYTQLTDPSPTAMPIDRFQAGLRTYEQPLFRLERIAFPRLHAVAQ